MDAVPVFLGYHKKRMACVHESESARPAFFIDLRDLHTEHYGKRCDAVQDIEVNDNAILAIQIVCRFADYCGYTSQNTDLFGFLTCNEVFKFVGKIDDSQWFYKCRLPRLGDVMHNPGDLSLGIHPHRDYPPAGPV